MQCPSCYNDSLISTEDGKLVCGECGEEFAGYREEEMDAFLAGTAVSNRESQSSHARNIRRRIAAKSTASFIDEAPSSSTLLKDDTMVCEGAFILAKAIADRLIELRFVHRRIKRPLFELLTHWAGRQHRGLAGIRFRYRAFFRPNHVLSLICLAALYVRSPMLPRDLCRLIATKQVPYLDAWKLFPENLRSCARIREAFTPIVMPTVLQICEPANIFARDVSAWPPIREFFKSNAPRGVRFVRRICAFTAFPVGHLHITLLRISRLLGLPDDFGARVLRFTELRMIAVKMARVLSGKQGGPWDSSRVDEFDIEQTSDRDSILKDTVELPAQGLDLYGFPTDESVQLDFINTMRLCYGRCAKRTLLESTDTSVVERENALASEWNSCLQAMERWLKEGNPEDIDASIWTCMPPNVISHLRGSDLRLYSGLVDDILRGLGDEVPELWGRFSTLFADIGAQVQPTAIGAHTNAASSPQIHDGCQYDVGRCQDVALFEPLQGRREMQERSGHKSTTRASYLRKPLFFKKDENKKKRPRFDSAKNPLSLNIGNKHSSSQLEMVDHGIAGVKHLSTSKQKRMHPQASVRSTKHQAVGTDSDDTSGDTDESDDAIPWIEVAEAAQKRKQQDRGASQHVTIGRDENSLERHQSGETSQVATVGLQNEGPTVLTQVQLRPTGNLGDANTDGAGKSIRLDRTRKTQDLPTSTLGRHESTRDVSFDTKDCGQACLSVTSIETDALKSRLPNTFLGEPKGLGLAWSITRCFFTGSNLTVAGIDQLDTVGNERQRMAMQLNHSMKMVISYLAGLRCGQ